MLVGDRLRARLARRLEQGEGVLPAAHALSPLWGAIAAPRLARPLVLPPAIRVIGVGSAVLGGAGKTPLAIALGRALAERGSAVTLVGHAYRARPGRARVVRVDDDPAEVGDDALFAARALTGCAVSVVVAPSRQAALDQAAALGAEVVIADGLLQSAPVRLAASVLVLDARAPFGAGICPPAGDLRAPVDALLAASTVRALITGDALSARGAGVPEGALVVPSTIATASTPGEPPRALATLRGQRAGLLVTVAHPERVLASLDAQGITPSPVLALADHATPSRSFLARIARISVSFWLTTGRCAVKLPPRLGAAPVLALDHHLDTRALVDHLCG